MPMQYAPVRVAGLVMSVVCLAVCISIVVPLVLKHGPQTITIGDVMMYIFAGSIVASLLVAGAATTKVTQQVMSGIFGKVLKTFGYLSGQADDDERRGLTKRTVAVLKRQLGASKRSAAKREAELKRQLGAYGRIVTEGDRTPSRPNSRWEFPRMPSASSGRVSGGSGGSGKTDDHAGRFVARLPMKRLSFGTAPSEQAPRWKHVSSQGAVHPDPERINKARRDAAQNRSVRIITTTTAEAIHIAVMSPKDMNVQYAPVPQHSVQAYAATSQPQVIVIRKPSAGGTKSCCWVAGLVLLSVVFLAVCLINIVVPLGLKHGPMKVSIDVRTEQEAMAAKALVERETATLKVIGDGAQVVAVAYVVSIPLLIVGTSLMAARWATTSRTTCLRVMYIFAGSIVVSLLVAAAVTLARYSRGNNNDLFNSVIVEFWKYEGGVCAVLLSVLALLIAIRWAMRDARAVPEPYSLELDDATSMA